MSPKGSPNPDGVKLLISSAFPLNPSGSSGYVRFFRFPRYPRPRVEPIIGIIRTYPDDPDGRTKILSDFSRLGSSG